MESVFFYKEIEYPGKQDFLQLVETNPIGDLLAIFGRCGHAFSCFDSAEEFQTIEKLRKLAQLLGVRRPGGAWAYPANSGLPRISSTDQRRKRRQAGALQGVESPSRVAMYKPNFCAECGNSLLRLRWYFWTSRKFCNDCARKLRKERFVPWLLAAVTLISGGFVLGRAGRPKSPPLTIVRRADSPLKSPEDPGSAAQRSANDGRGVLAAIEEIYMCGARTKKGTPCSRRVHGYVRCWQHKGVPAMLKQEKLLIKE